MESSFLPLSCKCDANSDGSLMTQIFDKATGRVDLLVGGVSTARLCSSREIVRLVTELRAELEFVQKDKTGGVVKHAV
ncbi:DUF1652 domain-containing protein [Pseudomonas sp.]|uniref:DUF1652 domain-containing protein n=1 Tax=Pseudomonas sp. TaxID=306 RepID=UPI0026103759|nr:DUF1652 domain-containing protein [Pseudomonas sp.]